MGTVFCAFKRIILARPRAVAVFFADNALNIGNTVLRRQCRPYVICVNRAVCIRIFAYRDFRGSDNSKLHIFDWAIRHDSKLNFISVFLNKHCLPVGKCSRDLNIVPWSRRWIYSISAFIGFHNETVIDILPISETIFVMDGCSIQYGRIGAVLMPKALFIFFSEAFIFACY